MHVFVTGASGFVGSAVVTELIRAGHRVSGLARSDASAAAVTAAGADAHRGDLTDLDSLRRGAEAADAVIHLAFHHDFDNFAEVFAEAGELDRRAIEALGETLAGSGRPLVVTSGIAGHAPGEVLTEDRRAPGGLPRVSEQACLPFAERGVRASVLRLPPTVHGEHDHGFVPRLIDIARRRGVSGYPGQGANRWSAVHRYDAARLYRLAVESAPAGTVLHAVGEQGIPVRDIAEVIARRLGLPAAAVAPESVAEHFGWLGGFFGTDLAASSAATRREFGWEPTEIGLLDDLDRHYFAATAARGGPR
ncbi:SDR family oxidoreductase [Mycolicibacterium palauense]|uniref:SDR family oxidoreductase n=1 Tax=Mycolicibacterium palauense TaxID=2034511 RepID=UPI000BFEF806|nr:SDR family oxidoreductase [Mycolicibacterium palauense]